MDRYYVFLYDNTHYGKGKKAVIRNTAPKSYGGQSYKPSDEKVIIKSIFDYSKEGYKFVTEFE